MYMARPKFIDSPYFVMDKGNWHLLPGAPEEVVAEFTEFKKIQDGTVNGRVDVVKSLESEK